MRSNNSINVTRHRDAYSANKPSNVFITTTRSLAPRGDRSSSTTATPHREQHDHERRPACTADGIRIDVTDGIASDGNRVAGNLATDTQATPTRQFGLNIADLATSGPSGSLLGTCAPDRYASVHRRLRVWRPVAGLTNGLVAQSAVVSAGSWAAGASVTDSTAGATRKAISPRKTDAYFAIRFRVASHSGVVYLLRFATTAAASPIAGLFVSSEQARPVHHGGAARR
jgi:hypothetical protein